MRYGIIYTIENKINGKIYVGQTTKSFNERYGGNISKTHNKHLRHDIEKYGIENFVIDKCICECDTKESLDEAEKFYIDFFDAMNPEHGYNKKDGGSNGLLSEETKEKISELLKGEKNPMYGKNSEDYMTPEAIKIKREKLSENAKKMWENSEYKKKQSEAKKGKYCGEKNPMYGKNPEDYMTEEAIKIKREKQSKALKGRPFSDEHKKKLSENHANVSGEKHPSAKPIVQLDKNGNFIQKWDYIGQATRELNISHISDVCKEKCKSAGGFKWMYLEDYIDLIKYSF